MSVATSTAIGLGIAGAGLVGGVASSAIGANASENAGQTQANSANYAANLQATEAQNALNFQEQQYNQGQSNLAPWLQSGAGALNQLDYLEGITPQGTAQAGSPAQASPTGQPLQTYNGNPATLTQPGAPGIGGTQPVSNSPLANRPTNTTAGRVGIGGQPTSTLAGLTPNATAATGSNVAGVGLDGQPARPSSPLGNGGALNPSAPGVPLSSLAGSPASATGIDPATGFQTGTGGGFGSLNQGWNQEFQAPTAAQAAATPGYQFQLQQGETALQNSAAAKGGLLSGNTAEALDQYSQGLASTNYQQTYNNALGQYQTAYNQFQNNQANQYNRLAGIAGTGQTAAGQLNSAGQAAAGNVAGISANAGQQIGQSAQNAGAATASGYVGAANAINSGIGSATGSAQQGLLLSQLLGGTSPYATGGAVNAGGAG
jgi:hypothetical protein